jgi:hypothetical protein
MIQAFVITDDFWITWDMAEKGKATDFVQTPSSHGYYCTPFTSLERTTEIQTP